MMKPSERTSLLEPLVPGSSSADIESGALVPVPAVQSTTSAEQPHSQDLWSALLEEGQVDDDELASLLLEKATTQAHLAALRRAVSCNQTHVVQALLNHGVDVNTRYEHGETPLMLAAGAGHTEMVGLLLDGGADAAALDEVGRTALSCATDAGHQAVLQLLGRTRVEKTIGETTTMNAARTGNVNLVSVKLLDGAADVYERDKDGRTMLMHAAAGGHQELVRLLLGCDADINAVDKARHTALMMAAAGGHMDTVKFLLDRGADMNVRSRDGQTAAMLAASRGHADVEDLLLERAARLHTAGGLEGWWGVPDLAFKWFLRVFS